MKTIAEGRKRPVFLSKSEIRCLHKMRALGLSTFELGEQFNVTRGKAGEHSPGVKLGAFGFFRCIRCERVMPITELCRWPGNGAKCKMCRARYSLLKMRELKTKVFAHYGERCYCCGESQIDFLTIDHANNDGSRHRAIRKRTWSYRWVIKSGYPSDLRVACYNCNCARRHGECPHKKGGVL